MTPGEARSDREKETDARALERVQLGIALLEAKYGVDWVEHIDTSTLVMSDGERCVLGQLYHVNAADTGRDGFEVGIDELGLEGDYEAQKYGFDRDDLGGVEYRDLQDAWVAEIAQRRSTP